jgi:hypothetical protein
MYGYVEQHVYSVLCGVAMDLVACKCLIVERNNEGLSRPETRLVKGESQTPPTNGYQKYAG